jgi:hypothetical protein
MSPLTYFRWLSTAGEKEPEMSLVTRLSTVVGLAATLFTFTIVPTSTLLGPGGCCPTSPLRGVVSTKVSYV